MHRRQCALVTGSTSGIGLSIAGELAAKGMNIVLNGFGDAAEIEALRERLAADRDARERHAQRRAAEAMMSS